MTTLRLYLRRSKADAGHQQFSIDTQRAGCRDFVEELRRRGEAVGWDARVEYVDDDRAGDDFLGREGLQRLFRDVQRGDIVLCRDGSRLGREAIDVTVAIRDLVRDRGARLFYYHEKREVAMATAIDAAMTFVQGTGHQMELEAIRARTREALRARVRAGRIAGGKCFGYQLVRKQDGSGREYTIAVIDEKQAEIVRRIFREYVEGWSPRSIAVGLNRERIPSPAAGKRGTGTWSPGCIRTMLLNERYHGVYIHGRVQRVRRGGKRVKVIAAPADVIRVEIPEWQIIDDITWLMAQDKFRSRPRPQAQSPRVAFKHILSGLARCICGGRVGVMRTVVTKDSQRIRLPAYSCTYHNTRGEIVCPVSVMQPTWEVEASLAGYLQRLLTNDLIDEFIAGLRAEIEQQSRVATHDVEALERELTQLKSEQKNLVRLAASGAQDVPELATAMKERTERMKRIQTDLDIARRSPAVMDALVRLVEESVRTKLIDLSASLLTDPQGARDVFQTLFPDGLRFEPVDGPVRPGRKRRRIWAIKGTAVLDESAVLRMTRVGGDPVTTPQNGTARTVGETIRAEQSVVPEVTPPGIEPGIAA